MIFCLQNICTTRPVLLPEVFFTTQPDPVPKSKTTTRQSLPGGDVVGTHQVGIVGGVDQDQDQDKTRGPF